MSRTYRGYAIAFLVVLLVLSILTLSTTLNGTTSVSAIIANEVGVYWDINCNNPVHQVDWGILNPGSVRDEPVYVQGEGAEPTYLNLSTTNWDPPNADDYITLRCNYAGQKIDPYDDVLQLTLTIDISRYIKGISNFSFDILLSGSDHLLGDVNGNGAVGPTDFGDLAKMVSIYSGFITGPPDLVARGDINGNGVVGPTDFGDLAKMFLIYSGIVLEVPRV